MSKSDLSLISELLEKYADVPGSLITILQNAQDIYGYLPHDVIEHISERTGIPCSKIMGVATFYAQFRFKPVGKYLIMLCKGTACHVNGANLIQQTLNDELGIKDGDTTDDGLFSLKEVACSLSPVMMINGKSYGSPTPDKTRRIINELREESK